MIIEQSEQVMREIKKVFIGKDEIIEKVLMAIYAGGHILLEDAPGVGKTTLALGFSRALDLSYRRIQFTPDTMPSDITGFSVYDKNTGNLEYKPGAASCNLLLGDEINRTSPKTQAALLEVMEEGNVTIDGVTHSLPAPFICIATQNHYGAAGTQVLPDLDRVQARMTAEDIKEIQGYLYSVKTIDDILYYISDLCLATREEPMVELGVSPRGVSALAKFARARAVLRERDYVVPEDVQAVFKDVCAHRLVMKPQAKIEGIRAEDILDKVMKKIKAPSLDGR